jgi:tetratricopeptide (TPR) repeat protein
MVSSLIGEDPEIRDRRFSARVGQMDDRENLERALKLFQEAYSRQMDGELDEAARLYQASIRCCPTAEAHTFLGWTFSFQGRYDDAIEECKKAIAIDPEFGNPYNDIGAYLINLERPDEAIPWLEKAIRAGRYEAYHYPHYNLGRVYLAKGMMKRALEEFEAALALQPDYPPARQAIEVIQQQLQ